MTKKSRVIILIFIFVFIILTIGLSFSYETKIKVKSNDIENIYFTGKIFNYYIFGSKGDNKLLETRILGISKKKAEIAGLLKTKINNYVVFTKENIINLYNTRENKFKTYKLDINNIIISTCISDIDDDFKDELLIITGKKDGAFGESLIIFSMDEELEEIYKKHFEDMNPWKIQTADVDGDGIKEISIGVYKKSQFHPVMAKRPFIYNWHGNHISPKWRGSRLSRPFEDYIFADIDGDGLDEIVSIEILENDKKRIINSYKWKGFGFEGRAESKEYEEVLDIKRVINPGKRDDVAIKVRNENEPEWIILQYSNEGLEIKRKLREYVSEVKAN